HDCFSFDQQEIRNMILCCMLDEPVAQIKSRHQVRAILLHFGDCSIVDVGTVLYRIHARLRRPQNPLRSMGVGCNLAAKTMGVCDNAFISSSVYCEAWGLSPLGCTPPVAHILIRSDLYFIISRALCCTPSTPSATPSAVA